MSERIKDLLAAAAGPTGQGDQGWHARGVDRLYFQHPTDVDAAGQVDVHRGDKSPEYVRVECWVRPELAAQMIALVTGASEGVETRLRAQIEKEIRDRLLGVDEVQSEPVSVEPVVETKLETQDRERMTELDRLIAEQQSDDEDVTDGETEASTDGDPEGFGGDEYAGEVE